MLSIDRQTNELIAGMDSEDFPLFSRIELLHRLVDVLSVNDEEDESLSSKPRTQRDIVSLGSISIQFLLSMGTILGEEPAGSLLYGFAFAFVRLTKSFASSCYACSSS